ncbi:hypothetical protein C3B44_08970 [Corynebacterium yudongzhengii]|uniref:Uncharacterized protein n=1 Tax=Corynebacterium yudongzhengii TaxID=2080740 RepID=A0A2U1T921_9CORY|nr:hypothetical protein [Corynebacterium yudongzhengii]AWB82462.1 hypothetical protein C3B44_08970 [Corynebacterium yudongzhengii]PWC02482.1 hypothetical protein DF222_02300 [Corynebacterium yudongzhengii]
MRILLFVVSAVFSLAAVGLLVFGLPRWVALIMLAVAGLALVGAMREQARQEAPRAIELDEKQRAQIRDMKAEGRHGAAIRQVQLWHRYATESDARRLVQEA